MTVKVHYVIIFSMNSYLLSLVLFYSAQYHVDPKLVEAVITVESGWNVNAKSNTNDVGLMQLNGASFPEYTQEELENPELNLKLGIKYLSQLKKECKHKNNHDWLVCWNYGIKNAEKVKYPMLFPFVKKVNLVYYGN